MQTQRKSPTDVNENKRPVYSSFPSMSNSVLTTDPKIGDEDLATAVRTLSRTNNLDYIYREAAVISAMRVNAKAKEQKS